VIVRPRFIFLGAHRKKKKTAAAQRRRSPTTVSGGFCGGEAADGGAAVCDDHGGVLGDVTFFLYRWLLVDGGGDGAQTPARDYFVSELCERKRRG
jgi:hypothetical protein